MAPLLKIKMEKIAYEHVFGISDSPGESVKSEFVKPSIPDARETEDCLQSESNDKVLASWTQAYSPKMKQEITDAVHHCVELLEQMDIINKGRSAVLSHHSKMIGEAILREVTNVLNGGQFDDKKQLWGLTGVHEPDAVDAEEFCEAMVAEENPCSSLLESEDEGESMTVSSSLTGDHELDGANTRKFLELMIVEKKPCTPPSKSKNAGGKKIVPFDLKLKIVKLAELHPRWSIKTLAKHSKCKLKDKRQLWQWKKQIARGGSRTDKLEMIDSMVYGRFQEARDTGHPVTTLTLQKWAMVAAARMQSATFHFKASHSWVHRFRARHNINFVKK